MCRTLCFACDPFGCLPMSARRICLRAKPFGAPLLGSVGSFVSVYRGHRRFENAPPPPHSWAHTHLFHFLRNSTPDVLVAAKGKETAENFGGLSCSGIAHEPVVPVPKQPQAAAARPWIRNRGRAIF